MDKRERRKQRREWARQHRSGTAALTAEAGEPVREPSDAPPPAAAPEGVQGQAAGGGPDLLLTLAEVCAALRVSRSTVERQVKAGAIPGRVKIGGRVRFHRVMFEDWVRRMAAGEVPA
jgi:excisionase family DNA binding protein